VNLGPSAIAILIVYLVVILGIGFWVKKRAGRGVESYFLGGRALPWWMIAMSGSSSYFDITGTMWIVSLIVMMGLKGMWVMWLWCFVATVFFASFMGKWIRRSGVVTGSEWMVTRFGAGRAGDTARLVYTIYAVLTLTAFLAYTAVGMGKFGSAFLPYDDTTCAALIIGVTGLYVVLGGFEGLVLAELLQTTILSVGAILIGVLGAIRFDRDAISKVVPADWWSIIPTWRLDSVADATFHPFGAMVICYLACGLLLGISGPAQLFDFQRFLATRNPREASKMGALWGVIHIVRWPMVMGITVLALTGIDLLDDPERALPRVIISMLPAGLQGLVLAALLAAFVSTFNAMVNGGASYIIRDIYHRYINPDASSGTLTLASRVASVLLIVAGVVISCFGSSINVMFTWIMGALGAGVVFPNILRWYWWRMNGQGYAAGALTGMVLSLVQAILTNAGHGQPFYVTFPLIVAAVAVVSVGVALLTPATDRKVLQMFFHTVRPFGFWGPIRRDVEAEEPTPERERFGFGVLAVLFGIPWMISLYLLPMYAIIRMWRNAGICAVVLVAFGIALYFVWYRNLPPESEKTRQRRIRY
jgi:Na+/proline symporter